MPNAQEDQSLKHGVCNKKRVYFKRQPNEEKGKKPTHTFPIQDSGRFLRDWGGKYAEVLMGQVLIGRPWNLAVCGEALQPQMFLDRGHFASERDPMFKFRLCLSPSVPWGGGETLGCSWKSKSLPLHMLQLRDLWFWSVVCL